MVALRLLTRASFVLRQNSVTNSVLDRLSQKHSNAFQTIRRNIGAYEGEGKTYGVIINKKSRSVFLLSAVFKEGFILSNGKEVIGSLIIFPNTIMSWHVTSAKDITEESLVLFKLLEPKLDILVLGYGSKNDFSQEFYRNFSKMCKNLGLRFEAHPTEQAIGIYNFLADERRFVAGALIPPLYIDPVKFERSSTLALDEGEEEQDNEDMYVTSDSRSKILLK